ncbi:unnamed protein product [Blepharisma stoltei]|uniref:Lipase n=1 Tax=Blepharisma stoltei TaxID=1481888 RepID=A0AAU9IRZ2_9CILI|nr:unnamed protein product [Blepharisma stoltei]
MDQQKLRVYLFRIFSFLKWILIPFGICLVISHKIEQTDIPPQATFTFEEHCKFYNYSFEKYTVTTDDDYILSLYRIPGKNPGPPVLLIHGLSNSANCFIVNQCAHPPAFILADQNFDIWLGNCRGSHLSRGHKYWNATIDEQYWDWSFPDIALYDLPAFVSFVKNHTGHEKIGMVGHSQGAAAILWMLGYYPHMKDDLAVGVLIGTSGSIFTSESPYIQFLSSSWLHFLCEVIGINVISDWSDDLFLTKFIQAFPEIAILIAHDLYDIKLNSGLPEHLGTYYHRMRGGTSIKNLKFWRQAVNNQSKNPKLYDYGPEENIKKYGSSNPPSINFMDIETPLAVINGKYDLAVPQKDSLVLKESIKKEKLVFYHDEYPHDHGGLMFSCNMTYFYQDVTQLLKKYLSQ